MCTTGIRRLGSGWLAVLLLVVAAGEAAEVIGEVQLRQTGLFQNLATRPTGGISVSLQPLEGQPLPRATSGQHHRLLVREGQLQPAYLTVQAGDTLHFINQDEVHHELFALSSSQPIELALDKRSAGVTAQAEVQLASEGVWHLFCRIHSSSYARVDAVATPLIRMVEPGETFRFEGLATGHWQLRVASPGAETRLLKAAAMTAPPPLRIELTTRGGGAPASRQELPSEGRIEALFPRN
jgi:plastocyanin